MIPDLQTPLVLEAITLHGIGSYLRGARLAIKPLTILCGENGSGKSTWLKALSILEESLDANRLPYGFKHSDWDPSNLQHTNAFFHQGNLADLAKICSASAIEEFGPPGTIGIETRAIQDHLLENALADERKGLAWNFLRLGRCVRGSRYRIRIAHPTYRDDAAQTPDLVHFVELTVDEKHTIRLVGERDPLQSFEEGLSRPRRSKPYTLSCSKSFLTGSDDDSGETTNIASLTELRTPRLTLLHAGLDAFESRLLSLEAVKLLNAIELRLKQVLGIALKGYFRLGAIRKPYTELSVDKLSQPADSQLAKRRHVGIEGEYAWRLERIFGENRMREEMDRKFEGPQLGTVWHTLLNDYGPKLTRIWERADYAKREELKSLHGTLTANDFARANFTPNS